MQRRRRIIAISSLALLVMSVAGVQMWRNLQTPSPVTALPMWQSLRSVELNNYNNWFGTQPSELDYNLRMQMLVSCNRISMTETYQSSCQMTPTVLKQMNPEAQVYRIYDLCVKNTWDSDWRNPADLRRLQTPLTRQMIDANDWWLRDGNGYVIAENSTTFMLDVGKPGFKEEYLSFLLDRTVAMDIDGIVFDYWYPDFSKWVTNRGLPNPPQYPNDAVWFADAWQPFITYVVAGLRQAGYTVIGNCAGEYGTTDKRKIWQRTMVDGTIYEQGAVAWSTSGGDWLPGYTIEQRIKGLAKDPLDLWFGNEGLKPGIVDLGRKIAVSTAVYYMGVPVIQDKRSFSYRYDGYIHWDPLWDFYIGAPQSLASQPYATSSSTSPTTRRYFWVRQYTYGLVILNYNSSATPIRYNLGGKYVTPEGNYLSGWIAVPSHSALILAKAGRR